MDEWFMAGANSEVKEFFVFILRLFKISGPLSPQHGSSGVEKATAEPEARVTHVRSPQAYMQVMNFVFFFFRSDSLLPAEGNIMDSSCEN